MFRKEALTGLLVFMPQAGNSLPPSPMVCLYLPYLEIVMSETQHTPTLRVQGGWFVSIEGIDGAGKTQATKVVAEQLRALGYDVVVTGEPGGTDLGKAVRPVFQASHDTLSPEAEVALLAACKAELLTKVIRPALASNQIVLCDRYTDSLFAYQAFAKGHGPDLVNRVLTAVNATQATHQTYYLDISLEVSAARLAARAAKGGEITSLDNATPEFRQALLTGFKKVLSPHGMGFAHRMYIPVNGIQNIAANRPTEDIATDIVQRILNGIVENSYEVVPE